VHSVAAHLILELRQLGLGLDELLALTGDSTHAPRDLGLKLCVFVLHLLYSGRVLCKGLLPGTEALRGSLTLGE
jgi:hypothetical protein